MSDHLGRMAQDDLEARLADLAAHLAFPPTPDLAGAVGSRLRTPVLRPRRVPRSLARSLLLAAALALLVGGGALAVRFGLDLLSITFGPIPSPAPAPSATAPGASAVPGGATPGPLGSGLRLGQPLGLEEARTAAAFEVLVPAVLGPPDVVYIGGAALRGQVAFIYGPRQDLPASGLLDGAGMLMTQNRGETDEGLAQKLLDTGQATVEPVDVNGAAGLWISGRPHFFWYRAPDGSTIQDSRRLVGDTLAWERDGILYRIEGAITLDQALEVARSVR